MNSALSLPFSARVRQLIPVWLLAGLVMLLSLLSHAAEPLAPEQAFRFSAQGSTPGQVDVRYDIAPGYYLYRERLRFSLSSPTTADIPLPPVELPAGEHKRDDFFGDVQIYRGSLRVTVLLPAGVSEYTLKVTSQGCADIGICYPPLTETFSPQQTGGWLSEALSRSTSVPSPESDATTKVAYERSESELVSDILRHYDIGFVMLSFFGFGLLLAFTPCMFPMVPILSGIIVGHGHHVSRGRAAALSGAYVLGMALTYAGIGIAAGLTGTLLSSALQSPWVSGLFALVFVGLAGSMFGWYELQMPSRLQGLLSDVASHQRRGALFGVAAMGALSALIAGPCVAAPLAGALLYIASTGDATLGGIALFTMALGMGTPLFALGVAARSALPRPGPWMNRVKQVFGVILLGTAVWVASPLLPDWTRGEVATPAFTAITGNPGLDARLAAAHGRPVMLDFYADWCVSCKEMERDTFSDPQVRHALEDFVLLKADVTANTADDAALLKRFGLFGPPGILFFDGQGHEITALRVIGFLPPERFLPILTQARQRAR